jgi:hypothetical protein
MALLGSTKRGAATVKSLDDVGAGVRVEPSGADMFCTTVME